MTWTKMPLRLGAVLGISGALGGCSESSLDAVTLDGGTDARATAPDTGTIPPFDAGVEDATVADATVSDATTDDAKADSGPLTPPQAGLSDTTANFGLNDCGGAAPANKVVTLTNKGGLPLTWTATIAPAGAFTLLGASSGTLAAGANAPITLAATAVAKSSVAGAITSATLTVLTNDPSQGTVNIPVTITAQGATFELLPSVADFGVSQVGVQAPDIGLALKNVGNKSASVSFGAPTSADYSISYTGIPDGGVPAPVTIAAGASLAGAKARFKPTSNQPSSALATIDVVGAVCGTSVDSVGFKGQGTSGIVSIAPGSLDFGRVNCGTTASSLGFTIANTGNSAYTWSASLALGNQSPYTLSAQGGILLPNTSVVVTAVPKAVPSVSATSLNLYGDSVQVTTNVAGDVPHQVALIESANGAILGFSDPSLTFGTQAAFVASAASPLTVTNSGNLTASVTISPAGGPGSSFVVSPAVASSVPGGGSLPTTIAFRPATVGPVSDSFSISTPTPLCGPLPAATTVSGTGSAGAATAISVGGDSRPNRGRTASACAIVAGGHVLCWGDGGNGQLGDGRFQNSNVPVGVQTETGFLSGAASLAGDGTFNCARLTNGSIYCWGRNDHGQLGDGTNNQQGIAVPVVGITNATAVTANHRMACALTGAGTAYCWGGASRNNGRNSLGNGSSNRSAVPVPVTGITAATAIAAGSSHACAATAGAVACWGNNDRGQIGNGSTSGVVTTPAAVNTLTTAVSLGGGGGRDRDGFECAVNQNGTISCWGSCTRGKLGNGSSSGGGCAQATSTAVSNITTATAVSLGTQHGCALTAAGTVQCWGRNGFSQLGNGNTTEADVPAAVPGLTGVTAISSGGLSTCALLGSGSVSCWGSNSGAAGSVPTKVFGF